MASKAILHDDLQVSDAIKSPRYMQIFSVVRDWIQQGHYAPGQRLESEKQLSGIFGVSRITVRKSLDLLAQEGLIETVQGKGTFVCQSSRQAVVHADMSQRVERARALAQGSQVDDLTIGTVAASPAIAADLRLNEGDDVMRISYVRKMQGAPIGYAESYFPLSLGVSVEADDFRTNTVVTLLEDKGLELAGIEHLVGATLADTSLAKMLSINVGAPLVRIRLFMLDLKQNPIQKVDAYFRADQYEHHIFLAR